MSTASAPACIVRPPWPDELPRLTDAFSPARFNRPLHPLLLVAPGAPERIVGFAGVLEPVEGLTGFTCSLRPRHLDSTEGDRLIMAALQLAESLGARSVRTADDLTPNGPLTPALLRAGFTMETMRGIWELSPAALAPRLDRIQERLAKESSLGDLVIEPLAAADRSGVKALLAATGLLSPERRYNLDLPNSGYDAGLSFVAKRQDRIVAAALAKGHARAALLELLTVDHHHRGSFDAPAWLLLQAMVHACLSAELPALIFSEEQKHGSSPMRTVHRSRGTCRGQIETYIRHFA